VLDALISPVREIYAVCVLAGLRPGEARALHVEDVNLGRRRVHVKRTAKDNALPGQPKVGPVKDHESRIVPVGDDLLRVLREYLMRRDDRQARSPFLFPTMNPGESASGMVQKHTIEANFREARDRLRLPKVNFYQASRHTFASHYIIDGGSIERLSKILGHCSVVVTERYSHLRSDHFTEHDLRPMLGLGKSNALQVVRGGRASKSGTTGTT